MRQFGDVSLTNPNARHADGKARALLLKECPKLGSLEAAAVLQFIEYLAYVAGVSLNVAFPWVQVISADLVPSIVGAYERCFETLCLENLSDVSPRQLVKVLGRMCEVKHWSAFINLAKPLFKSFVWERSNNQNLSWAWQQVQAVLQRLALVVPFFGRRVGWGGGTLSSRDCTFAKFYAQIVPVYVADPMLDRVYSPSYVHVNAAHGLHEDPGHWVFADYSNVIRVLIHHAIMNGGDVRRNLETQLEFNNMAEKLSKPLVRAHALQSWHEDRENNDQYNFEDEAGLASMPPSTSVARNKAYGGSGSGQPSERLNRVIERSADRAKPTFCYKHVLYGSCHRGKECSFLHPRSDQWTPDIVEWAQAQNAKRAESTRDDRPGRSSTRYHNIDLDSDGEDRDESKLKDVPAAEGVAPSVRLKEE
jgi:hypothetical protein